jgi:transposase
MAKPDTKKAALQAQGALHPRPATVADENFESNDFFDARDLVQVKYEMLRRVRVDGHSVTRAATDFGFSRPSYYQAKGAFEREGISGLVPRKRGPKGAHKLTGKVVDYLEESLQQDPSLRAAALSERIAKRFGIQVHPRSVERALIRRRDNRHQKKGLR